MTELVATSDPLGSALIAAPATVEWLHRHFGVVVVANRADSDGLTRVAHVGPRLQPRPLRALYGALLGLSPSDVVVPRIALGALPRPVPGQRHPAGLSPLFAGHPVFFLPEEEKALRPGEDEDAYAFRLWAALAARGVADLSSGTVVDLLAAAGIAIADESARARVAVWVAGGRDVDLDAFDLPAPGGVVEAPTLDDLRAEVVTFEQAAAEELDELLASLLEIAAERTDDLLESFDAEAGAHQAAEAAAEAVGVVHTVLRSAHLLRCVARSVGQDEAWPTFDDLAPVEEATRRTAETIATLVNGGGIAALGRVREIVAALVDPCLSEMRSTAIALGRTNGGAAA